MKRCMCVSVYIALYTSRATQAVHINHLLPPPPLLLLLPLQPPPPPLMPLLPPLLPPLPPLPPLLLLGDATSDTSDPKHWFHPSDL